MKINFLKDFFFQIYIKKMPYINFKTMQILNFVLNNSTTLFTIAPTFLLLSYFNFFFINIGSIHNRCKIGFKHFMVSFRWKRMSKQIKNNKCAVIKWPNNRCNE